jgi:hypothetical protein
MVFCGYDQWWELLENGHLEDQEGDGWRILRLMFGKWDDSWNWLRIVSNGRFFFFMLKVQALLPENQLSLFVS